MTVRRAAPLCAVVLPLLISALPASAQSRPPMEAPVVVTAGDAVVRATPSRAHVDVTAESRAGSPRDAQRKTAEVMKRVQDRLRGLSIPAEAIRTTAVNLSRHYDYVDGKQVPRDYVAVNSIEVRVDELDRLGEIIDAAVAAGATSVGDVRFDVSDRSKYEREALTAAVSDARARAQAMAAGAGRSLDRILRIEEPGLIESPPMPMPVRAMAMREAKDAAQTPIAPGQMEFRARVVLTVALVP